MIGMVFGGAVFDFYIFFWNGDVVLDFFGGGTSWAIEGIGTAALGSSPASSWKKLFRSTKYFLFKILFFIQMRDLLFISIWISFPIHLDTLFEFILQLIFKQDSFLWSDDNALYSALATWPLMATKLLNKLATVHTSGRLLNYYITRPWLLY